MTVQEIQEVGFEKAVFGGYDINSVDSFLERVAEEFAAMQKENAALKSKMKVLVDKIEEYRSVEDGMRRTLISARAIAQDTMDKAKQEAEQIVSAAKNETETKIKTMREEIVLEEQRLETARKNTMDFIAHVTASYKDQVKLLADLVTSEKLVPSEPRELEKQPELQSVEQAQNPSLPAAQQDAPSNTETEGEINGTRKFDFGELKFGTEYDPKK